MDSTLDSPKSEVVEIYDLFRHAALNKDYYGAMLARYQRINTIYEIAIAMGATGSGLSGLAIWKDEQFSGIWASVWTALTLVSSILALAKPFLQLGQKVERYSRLFTGHLDNFLVLQGIVSRIRRKGGLTPELASLFETAEQRFLELSRDDDPKPNQSVIKKSDERVRQQFPNSWFWIPDEPAT